MKYGPQIESFVPLKMFQLGSGYEGFLFHQIKSSGLVQYLHIFAVFKDKNPVLYYCAEKGSLEDSLFIGVFDDRGHKNLGIDSQANDSMSFLMKAIDYSCSKFGLEHSLIKEIPAK